MLSAAVAALLAVVAIVGFFNRRLAAELDRTAAEHRRVLKTEGQLDQTLTRSVARRLDSDLRELAAIPLTMAALLEKTPEWSDSRLEKVMRDLLGKQPMIFGICVAMEPHQWRADREDFALYVYRSRGGLAAHQLVPPVYQPGYRQWPWYYAAKQAPQGRWCEPYVDPCADRTPMVTFSAPIRRQGRFVGVVTADLAMDYFRWLRKQRGEPWTWVRRPIASCSAPGAGSWPTATTASSFPMRTRTPPASRRTRVFATCWPA